VARDQTCGVPRRFIGGNVALLRDVVHYANDADLPLAILSSDQEKAFDRVDWPFLQSTLSRMGFGFCFTLTFGAPSSSTVTLLVTLTLLRELDRVAPCLLSSMF